jgi:hypothetical protein
MFLRCLLVFGLSCAALSMARANSLDDDTSCGAIAALLNGEDGKEKLPEVVSYILGIGAALDRAQALRGKPQILSRMTEEGRFAMALVVVDRCQARPELTVADTAVQTYEAVRTMQKALASSRPGGKVQSHSQREPGQRSRNAPRSGTAALGLFDTLR